MGIDVGILPTLMENIPTRDHYYNNGIWAETTKIVRSPIFDYYLQIKGPGSNVGLLTNMPRFYINSSIVPAKNAEVLHNNLK